MTAEAWIGLGVLAVTVVAALVAVVWQAATQAAKNERQESIARDHENRIRSLEGKRSPYKRDPDTIKFPEEGGTAS
jgi:hypothetical protein